jgi:hypothetical protein
MIETPNEIQPAAPPVPSRARIKMLVGVAAASCAVIVATAAVLATTGSAGSSQAQLRADLILSNVAYNSMSAATADYSASARKCKVASDRLSCITALDGGEAHAYSALARLIRTASWPAGQIKSAASELATAAAETASSFRALQDAMSLAQYGILADQATDVSDVLQVDQDYGYLRFLIRSA